MDNIDHEKLAVIRNKLLQEAKQTKLPDYIEGYVDGILDMYNLINNELVEVKTKS